MEMTDDMIPVGTNIAQAQMSVYKVFGSNKSTSFTPAENQMDVKKISTQANELMDTNEWILVILSR